MNGMDSQQTNTTPQTPTPAVSDPDIQENKDIAALSYVWILSVFVYLYRRQSAFVRHHARQGIVLFILSILFWMIPVAGRFLDLIVLALMVMGFLNAAQGRYAPLPLIYALSHGDIGMLRQSWKGVVDAIVRLWHRVRSRKHGAGVKVSVQATVPPSAPDVPPQNPHA
jgi:uncharacterized membrane protein